MANNTTNRLRVEGSGADKVQQLMETTFDDGEVIFDFNRVIPQPPLLHKTWNSDLGRLRVADIGLALLGFDQNYAKLQKDWELCRDLGEKFSLPQLRSYAKKVHPDAIEEARLALRNREETGFDNWREWASACWGATANSYGYLSLDVSSDLYECYFETRWSPVVPVITELSRRFPALKFRYYALDEGGWCEEAMCYNAGQEIKDSDWFDFCHAIYGDLD